MLHDTFSGQWWCTNHDMDVDITITHMERARQTYFSIINYNKNNTGQHIIIKTLQY